MPGNTIQQTLVKSVLSAAVLAAVSVRGQVVINEIHFDPVAKMKFEEFVEIHNAGGTAIDLSDWSLRSGVDFTFSSGTTIPANGYIVVAENPTVLNTLYGTSAFGPWDGKLSNDGDDVQLHDAMGTRVDRVEYGQGFPWPTLGSQDYGTARSNASMELLHPLLDNNLGGSWRSSGMDGPSPGVQNRAYQLTGSIPPQIRQVKHEPEQPAPEEPVTVTAKITDPDGMGSVVLSYQTVDPGTYIGITDAVYATSWTQVPMVDDGTGGDAMAGDSVFTAVLPGSLQTHRRLVRYRIAFEDGLGNSETVPYADDPQPNFAYFCYEGIPEWQAAIRPGTTPAINFGTNVMRRLPAVHLISKISDVEDATWFERYAGDLYKWSGTLVYDGKVYDHIHYRMRGGMWRYAMVKNMWKFDFNRGHDFEMRDDYGRKYDTKWTKLNLGACIQQKDSWHRGEQGMFESVGSRLFQLAGVPSFNTSFLQLRIIGAASESTADQYTGDFWGLYLAVEQFDGRFLDEHGLPDGNFYKMDAAAYGDGDLNNLGPLGPDDKSDLYYLLGNYGGADNSPAASDAWWEANWNLDDYYSYQTIVQAIHHYDINAGKNFFYYRNPDTGIWSVIPWDLDLTWADNMFNPYWGGMNTLSDRILDADSSEYNLMLPGTSRTAFRIAFRNRIREIRDLLFNPEQTGQLIDEKAGLLRSPGSSPSFLDADRAMWDFNPKMDNSYYTPYVSKAETGHFYQWPMEPEVDPSFEGCIQLMKNYVATRGALLDALAADAAIPNQPTIAYVGAPGYPLNELAFYCTSLSDPQGFSTIAGIQWRAAEVLDVTAPAYNPGQEPPYEINSQWESDLASYANTFTIPVDALRVGHAYRVRARTKDNTGRWSHWSSPVEFVPTESSSTPAMMNHLRISELMYNPPSGSDYEFIELHNTSMNQTIDISGAAFTKGIDFKFPEGSLLEPNGYLLLIGTTNKPAFRMHYGLPINTVIRAGSFTGNLSNDGEELTLKTAEGGTKVFDFDYGSGRHWPLAAAGSGHSLIPLSADGQATGALDYPGNWRASAYIGGSPGSADPEPEADSLVLNEITAHTDYADPYLPEYDSDDWIEIHNLSTASVNLADWYLSDDPEAVNKWACPAISIPAGGFVVFNEVSDFHHPITTGFGLDKAGEQVLLSYLPGTGSNRVADAVGFKGQEKGRSLSRIDGYWSAALPSADSANNAPHDGLRISEIMYWPIPLGTNDNVRDEFIEIFNPTASNITMETDGEAWRIDGGVEFIFPDNTVVPAGSVLIVVGFDPADIASSNAFTTAYGITNAIRLFGPWDGRLGNRSERVTLERPQAPDFPGDNYSWVIEDETFYGNQQPWPAEAASNGSALARMLFNHSGLDPSNWFPVTPTAGEICPTPFADQDGDGINDEDEVLFGTDPFDAASRFWLQASKGTNLSWHTATGRLYTVYWTGDLRDPFVPIAAGLPFTQSNMIDFAHAADPQGFYRVGVELETGACRFLDQDGDGMSDYDEWIFGSDMNNPSSRFTFGTSGGTNLSWYTAAGRIYSILWTADLTVPFSPIATGLPYTQSNYIDSAHSTEPQGFYRIGVELQ